MTASFSSRLARAGGNLVVAMLNATLILVIVALVLVWRVSIAVETATTALATTAHEQVSRIAPVRDQLGELTGEIAGLRGDLTTLRDAAGADSTVLEGALETALAQLDDVEARLADAAARVAPAVEAVAADPGVVVDRAVQTGVGELGAWLVRLRGCGPAPRPTDGAG